MSNDTASLVMRVESLEVQVADNRLRNLERSAGGAEKASDGLTGSFKQMPFIRRILPDPECG